jgi:hypothetical protein
MWPEQTLKLIKRMKSKFIIQKETKIITESKVVEGFVVEVKHLYDRLHLYDLKKGDIVYVPDENGIITEHTLNHVELTICNDQSSPCFEQSLLSTYIRICFHKLNSYPDGPYKEIIRIFGEKYEKQVFEQFNNVLFTPITWEFYKELVNSELPIRLISKGLRFHLEDKIVDWRHILIKK